MGCSRFQEALSARLDGERLPMPTRQVDAHLRACPACREWERQATRILRLTRPQPVAGTSRPLDIPPGDRSKPRRRLVHGLRLTLAALGAAQFVLGMAQVSTATAAHTHDAGHLFHESAAWNVAIGAGFAYVAARRVRPAGTPADAHRVRRQPRAAQRR